jgi:hypothetical protein
MGHVPTNGGTRADRGAHAVTDWGPVDVSSRAASTLGSELGVPMPVVAATPDGQHPLGDPTRWGGEVDFVVSVGGDPVEVASPQVVRAQVADHRARHWRWQAQLQGEPVGALPVASVTGVFLEWSIGVGQIAMVQRYDLALLLALSPAIGWPPLVEAGSVTVWIQSVPGLTDVLGEAVACRLVVQASPLEGPSAVRVRFRQHLLPSSVGS